MDSRPSHHKRRSPWWIATLLFVVIGGFGLFFRGFFSHPDRVSVALMGDPVVVASWDTIAGTLVVVSLPAEATIDGTRGYGPYSLDALWKLGAMDKKEGILLTESIEELLGLPVRWYISGRRHELLQAKDPISQVRQTFSLSRLFSFLAGRYASNMPFSSFAALSWALGGLRIDTIRLIDLAKGNLLVDQSLPDGSVIHVVDKDRLDQKIASLFEDERIRKEGLSVAIYNTTQSPSLGTRAGRLLSHAGLRVVAVGNDTTQLTSCSVTGGKKELASITASFIVGVFGCTTKDTQDSLARADIILRLGTDYQSRFLPFAAAR